MLAARNRPGDLGLCHLAPFPVPGYRLGKRSGMKTYHCAQLLGQPPVQVQVLLLEEARQALNAAQTVGSALMVIHPEGRITVDTDCPSNDLRTLQEAVGGYLEAVTLTRPQVSRTGPYLGYVNEEGLLHGLEYNPLAAELFGVQIVGPLAVQVGFSLNHNGDTIPTPIQNGTQPC